MSRAKKVIKQEGLTQEARESSQSCGADRTEGVRATAERLDLRPPQQSAGLSDDAIVDQRSVPAPPDLYLRLAREGRFPSNKIGKRICARWGDVKAAFLGGPGVRRATARPTGEEGEADNLNDLRRQLGFVPKGK